MASSKTLMLFGLVFAIFLISAEVSARDLAETTQTQESMQLDGHYHYGHGGYHGGYHGGHHGGHHGGSAHDEYEDGHHSCHGHHCHDHGHSEHN